MFMPVKEKTSASVTIACKSTSKNKKCYHKPKHK